MQNTAESHTNVKDPCMYAERGLSHEAINVICQCKVNELSWLAESSWLIHVTVICLLSLTHC